MFRISRIVSSICSLSKRGTRTATSHVPKEGKINVRNCDINYLKVGHGPHHVLCMPGIFGVISHFKPQIEGFDREKFTLVVWDPPGYGKSRPPEKEFDPDFFERDAHDSYEFMKALEIPEYSLLGWSGGGISSLIHTAMYPSAVQKLVVCGALSFVLPHEIDNYKRVTEFWLKKMSKTMMAEYGPELFTKYCKEWPEGMERILKERDGNICVEMLKDIRCPTFILYGQKDNIIDGTHASHLHTHIRGSKIHLYPDGEHDIHVQYAEDFNKRVQEFLLLP